MAPVSLYMEFFSSVVNPSTSKAFYRQDPWWWTPEKGVWKVNETPLQLSEILSPESLWVLRLLSPVGNPTTKLGSIRARWVWTALAGVSAVRLFSGAALGDPLMFPISVPLLALPLHPCLDLPYVSIPVLHLTACSSPTAAA